MNARSAWPAALLLLLLVPAVRAQERPGVEVAPFAGYRYGGGVTDAYSGAWAALDGAASFGVAVDVPVSRGAALELLFSRQSTGVDLERYPELMHFDLTVDHWMAGIRSEFPTQNPRIRPFLTLHAGFTHFSGDSGETTGDTRFTAALGGGVVFDVAKHLAVRLDARGYAVFVDSGAGLFCGGGGCAGTFSGQAMFQGEVAAALVVIL